MALMNQAALLDELFGIDRNSTVKKEITWDDESICKYYLAGFCPHDLFVNTKMSLGACPKVHDSKLYEKYKNSSKILRMGYERRLKSFLQRYVDDVKKKILYNIERMENGLLSGTEVGIQKRITLLEREINELVKNIEICGNEGRIEECSNLNSELEEKQKTLKYDRIELETQRRNTRERLEEVCSICGAYISKNDPRNSLENHVSGRIHCSYVKINEILNDLNETLKNIERDSIEREISREKERSRSSNRHKHRSRDIKRESFDSRERSSDSRHRRSHRKKRSNRSRSRSYGKSDKHRRKNEDYDKRRDRNDDYDKRKDRNDDYEKRSDKKEDSYKRKERKVDEDQRKGKGDGSYKRKEKRDDSDKRKERKEEDNDKRKERRDDNNDERREKRKDDRKDKSWGEI